MEQTDHQVLRFLRSDHLKYVGLLIGGGVGLLSYAPARVSGPGITILFEAFAALAGAGLILSGFVSLRKKRLIENVPRSWIRSVALGFAEIHGVARPRITLQAPLTGFPCVYYRYVIEEESGRGKLRPGWKIIQDERSTEPFHLEDPTGRILVDPEGAEIVLREAYKRVEGVRGWGFARRKRHRVWWIVQGQKVYALGTVGKTRDMAREGREALNERLRELKRDQEALGRFDTDRDGTISAEEWSGAVLEVKDRMLREEVERPQPKPEDDLVLGKGTEEATFVLADRSEGSVARALALKSIVAIVSGIGILAWAWFLLVRGGILPAGW